MWEVSGGKDFEHISDCKGIGFVSMIGLTVMTIFVVSILPVARYKEMVLKWAMASSISLWICDSHLSLCLLLSAI